MNDLRKNLPPYSVLMSVYYKENPVFLRKSLDSMFGQTVQPDEIVMIEDGGLTPELYEVLDDFSAQYGKAFRRIKNEYNSGLGKALNRGVTECSNEIIARMDTDDLSCPERCEKQLEYMSEYPEIDVVGTCIAEFVTTPDNIVSERAVPQTHEDICRFMKKRNPFNHMTVMYKKSAVIKAGNYLESHYNEDFFLWIRMYLNYAKFANLAENLVFARVGKEMFARRGGRAYYKSEKNLFKYMYKHKIISWWQYQKAKAVRFVVQVLMTNKMRQWFFRKYARKNSGR